MAESADTITIKTPNGHEVVIRNYTTHGDDKQASSLLNEGLSFTSDEKGKPQVVVSATATAAAEDKYIELLVQSIDGSSDNIVKTLDTLRSADYDAIAKAVREITTVPKATRKS